MAELGRLSARYESGKRGSAAVGWDSRGGASYGRFQIATAVGTMDRFLIFCEANFPDLFSRLDPVRSSMGDRAGAFARTWVDLSEQSRIAEAEYEFIKATHYEAGYSRLGTLAKSAVDRVAVLREILWSTCVQHGPGAAPKIFDFSWSADTAAMIRGIYQRRGERLSRLTRSEQAAVRDRYQHEQADALAMLANESKEGS
jgi:hypothetical protein